MLVARRPLATLPFPAALAMLTLAACGTPPGDTDPGPIDTDPPGVEAIMLDPAGPQTLAADGYVTFAITGLLEGQAYRVTLVHGDNLTSNGDGTAVFQDLDANGYADAGPSETVAVIDQVNYGDIVPAKTVPSPQDNPANPTGVFQYQGQILVRISAVGGGTVYPVVYHNGGVTTFLEVDQAGSASEVYYVGPSIYVDGPVRPIVQPAAPTTIAVDDYQTYSITGLDDDQAYRITLVKGEYLTATGQDGVFQDNDANGYADAGTSEEVALITAYNGNAVNDGAGAKTIPGAADDPAAPTGVYPTAGSISIDIKGVGPGTVYPVVYHNGGVTTFLEVDPVTYAPTEIYTVGGSLSVTGP